ncbi:RNA polymerase sigma factor [Lysobacter sp. A3-1-A15]|uniref:RNA polymerase sigma factor n=1 Tax=Novilysobacter viscosus TaxID=3098602 RepID=UPI002ED7E847
MNETATTMNPVGHADFLAAQRGDRNAFARLVLATQKTVASVALAVTRDVQLSEDIAQDTFVKAWQRIGSMQDPESLLPWLRQVTRNGAIDHVRRRRHQEVALDVDDPRMVGATACGPEPDTWMDHRQRSEQLARALDAVPDDSREVLLLFYREGQSSRHVAALLGLSDGAVRKRLQRARDALQSELLAQVGEVARHSAPGLAFAALVVGSLGPREAAATTATAAGGKWALGALGSVLAALALVLGAVMIDVRLAMRRARTSAERSALLRHGLLYAAVMASFVGMLFWSSHADWSQARLLAVSGLYSLVIIALGVGRARIHRRHRRDR